MSSSFLCITLLLYSNNVSLCEYARVYLPILPGIVSWDHCNNISQIWWLKKTRNVLCHSSGGQKCKIKVLTLLLLRDLETDFLAFSSFWGLPATLVFLFLFLFLFLAYSYIVPISASFYLCLFPLYILSYKDASV